MEIDREHLWLLLEFFCALEKKVYCGYDGSFVQLSPSSNTWLYYIGNQKGFEDSFTRFRPRILYISQKCSFHHHAIQVGHKILDYLKKEYKNISISIANKTPQTSEFSNKSKNVI